MVQAITTTQKKIYEDKSKTIGVFAVPEFEYYYVYSQNHLRIEEYKEAYTQLLEIAGTKYNFNKLVLSLGNLVSTPLMGRAWFAAHFSPSFYKKVNKDLTAAVIKPQNKFEAVTIDIISGSLPKMGINVKTQFFKDEQNAIKWIENPIFE